MLCQKGCDPTFLHRTLKTVQNEAPEAKFRTEKHIEVENHKSRALCVGQTPPYLETGCIISGVLRLCNFPKNMIYLFSMWTLSCFSQSLCVRLRQLLTRGLGRPCGPLRRRRRARAASVSAPPAGEGTYAELTGSGTGAGLRCR